MEAHESSEFIGELNLKGRQQIKPRIGTVSRSFGFELMNYLDDDVLENGIAEIFRVSKRWIMHCEKYEKTEKQIDENHKFRNMGEKWLDYKIKFVSDVDLHEDYGQENTRFTLLKKV